jgi:hypothetical protein
MTISCTELFPGGSIATVAEQKSAAIPVEGCTQALVDVSVARVAATECIVKPYISTDGGLSFIQMRSMSVTAGTGTRTAFQEKEALSGNAALSFDFDISKATHVKFGFVFTGATTDLFKASVAVS